MRRIALILTLIACAGIVAYVLLVGWPTPRVETATRPGTATATSPTRSSADLERPEAPGVSPTRAPPRVAAVPVGTRLEIRVVDETGCAAEGIRVRVLDALTLEPRFQSSGRSMAVPDVMTTGADGTARWEDLQPGDNWRWTAQSPTHQFEPEPPIVVRGWSGPFTLRASETTRLTGTVVSTLSIVGRVADGDFRPLPRIHVQARPRVPDPRTGVRSATTDVDGRFVLDRLPLVPFELLACGADAPDSLAFVRLDVDPVAAVRLDVGVLRPSGRVLHVRTRALDASGADVTEFAGPGATTGLPLDVVGCTLIEQRLVLPLGGSFRLVGFDCEDLAVRLSSLPPRSSCSPGWTILWDGAPTDIALREGEVQFDVAAIRAELLQFTAPAIHRDGVPDQHDVATLRVSLVPEGGGAAIDFSMRAMLGLPFGNERVVPHGRYRLEAKCEDDGRTWTASSELRVDSEPREPVRIDLVRVH